MYVICLAFNIIVPLSFVLRGITDGYEIAFEPRSNYNGLSVLPVGELDNSIENNEVSKIKPNGLDDRPLSTEDKRTSRQGFAKIKPIGPLSIKPLKLANFVNMTRLAEVSASIYGKNEANENGGLPPHLQHFKPVSWELEFPDGLEGPIPVTVKAPFENDSTNCPICNNSHLTDITSELCKSSSAMRLERGPNQLLFHFNLTLLDILGNSSQINATANDTVLINLPFNCVQCRKTLNTEANKNFIVYGNLHLVNSKTMESNSTGWTLQLDNRIFIRPITEQMQSELLESSKNDCNSNSTLITDSVNK